VPDGLLGRFLEDLISGDTREEHEFARSYGSFEAAYASTQKNLRRARTRAPKTEAQIDEWTRGTRAKLRTFDREIASTAARPIEISLNSDRRLEDVEVELVFEGVVGVEATMKTLSDIWSPLHVEPKPDISSSINVPVDSPGMPEWAQDGNDVVVTVYAGGLRNRRKPVIVESLLVLMIPCTVSAPAPSEITYTWRVTAANIDQDLTGEGTIPVMRDADAALARWWVQQSARR
jgi:hypothetical protein